jgi:hypothetical protein
MNHCKHCIKKCKAHQACDNYQPYSIDALEKEKRTATPARLKEILAKLDFYYYGRVI